MYWGNISTAFPYAFQGLQTGVGSWFRANNPIDSTNGHSWCGFPYQDSSPLFAIDLTAMANGSNPVYPDPGWYLAGKQYCGLEVSLLPMLCHQCSDSLYKFYHLFYLIQLTR